MPDAMSAAVRTQHLLIILADWLNQAAERPSPERVACAACLAEAAKTSADQTVKIIDGADRGGVA